MDRLLRESGIDFEKVNYYIEPLTGKKLSRIVSEDESAGARTVAHQRADLPGTRFEQGRVHRDEIISLMIEHPDLIQRPIVERGDSRCTWSPNREC